MPGSTGCTKLGEWNDFQGTHSLRIVFHTIRVLYNSGFILRYSKELFSVQSLSQSDSCGSCGTAERQIESVIKSLMISVTDYKWHRFSIKKSLKLLWPVNWIWWSSVYRLDSTARAWSYLLERTRDSLHGCIRSSRTRFPGSIFLICYRETITFFQDHYLTMKPLPCLYSMLRWY